MHQASKQSSFTTISIMALLAACDLRVDADLVKNPANSEDGSIPCQAATCSPGDGDGGGGGGGDAGEYTQDDAGSDGDAAVGCSSASCQPCTSDEDCDAHHFCSLSGACAPRDSETLGRAGPVALHNTAGALAVGDQVYWGTYNTRVDTLGNPLGTGEIWSWDGEGEPVRVASGFKSPVVRFARNGYLYVHETSVAWDPLGWEHAADLVRIPLSGEGPIELIAEDAFSGWQTENYVWWSAKPGANVELWRMATPSDTRELVSSGSHSAWLVGTETAAYWPEYDVNSVPPYQVVQHTFDTSATERVFGGSDASMTNLRFEDGYAYFLDFYGLLYGVDLSQSDVTFVLGGAPLTYSYYDVQNEWVYWITDPANRDPHPTAPTSVVIARTPRDASSPRELIAEIPATGYRPTLVSVPPLAVGDSKIFYYNPFEARLFARPLPPLPCSDGRACPPPQTCGQDFLCH